MKRCILIRLGIFFASDSLMSLMSLLVDDKFMSHRNFFFLYNSSRTETGHHKTSVLSCFLTHCNFCVSIFLADLCPHNTIIQMDAWSQCYKVLKHLLVLKESTFSWQVWSKLKPVGMWSEQLILGVWPSLGGVPLCLSLGSFLCKMRQ